MTFPVVAVFSFKLMWQMFFGRHASLGQLGNDLSKVNEVS